ncbi:MAG: cysteine methyltransferase [Rhodospirillales bacterium]|nr:cysteine methyltransferase [Rhodospirillales bacterium]
MSTELLTFTMETLLTPVGGMLVVADADGRLRALDWEDHESRMLVLFRRHYGGATVSLTRGRVAAPIREALADYLGGDLAAIERIPVATGGTAFQRRVWEALRRVPAGRTVTYTSLAASIGRPTAVRAIGHANGANPVGIVVPCHRVIGADGSLTGYGGGLERKRWLLAHESSAHQSAPNLLSR